LEAVASAKKLVRTVVNVEAVVAAAAAAAVAVAPATRTTGKALLRK